MTSLNRTVTYRRASWDPPSQETLQHVVKRIHRRLDTTAARTFHYQNGLISGLAWEERDGVFLGHVAQYSPDQPTSLVPKAAQKPTANTSPLSPPSGQEFLDGDLMFLLWQDHLLLCLSGAREPVLSHYLELGAQKIGMPSLATACSLEPVANLDKFRLIRTEGIKKIRLEESLSEAAYVELDEATPSSDRGLRGLRNRIMASIAEAWETYFEEDKDLQEIGERENINVKLDLVYDRRRKGGDLGMRRMEATGAALIQQEHEGFKIVTGSEKTIESGELKISRKVDIQPFGSSIDRNDAWKALLETFYDLRSEGVFDS